jgi:hypothetical protein
MSTKTDDDGTKTRRDIANSLNKPPLKSGIRVREGRAYLPISYVEMALDVIFGPLGWQTRNFQTNTVINEVCGSVELWVRDPESGEWVVKTGAGAVQIQLAKGSDVLNVANKIKTCMEYGYPHLLSDCLRNAALKLGKHLGRDLARKQEDRETYTEIIVDYSQKFRDAIASLTTAEDVKIAWNTLNVNVRQFDEVKEIYKAKMRDLERKHLEGGGTDE